MYSMFFLKVLAFAVLSNPNYTEIFLTERGKEYIELMSYIRDSYKSHKC
jgi:hypothetical protein